MAYLIWITGLSGSGKTTLAKLIYNELKRNQNNIIMIDGDDLRKIFTDENHSFDLENRKKLAFSYSRLCELLVSQGVNVICSTISLFKDVHLYNREHIKNYYEIYIECKIEDLIINDTKDIYTKKNIVGLDLPFDKPENCDLIIKNDFTENIDKYVQKILDLIES